MSPWLFAIGAFLAFQIYKARKSSTSASRDASSTPAALGKSVVVVMNTICFGSGAFYFITVSHGARFICMTSSVVGSLAVIYTNYGLPKVSRASIRAPLQEYFARCMHGAEFSFLFFTLLFMNDTTSQSLGVIPFGLADYVSTLLVVRRSLWFLGSHGSTAWTNVTAWTRIGQPLWTRLNARSANVIELTSVAEIIIGFWLLLLIITPARQLLVCFVYWNFLRIRYLAPRSKASHVAAWSRIDASTRTLRRSVPFLEKPVSFMQRWFNPVA